MHINDVHVSIPEELRLSIVKCTLHVIGTCVINCRIVDDLMVIGSLDW